MSKLDFSGLSTEGAKVWEAIEGLRATLEQLSWFSISQKIVLDALAAYASPEAIKAAVEALEAYAKKVENPERKEQLKEMAKSYKNIIEFP